MNLCYHVAVGEIAAAHGRPPMGSPPQLAAHPTRSPQPIMLVEVGATWGRSGCRSPYRWSSASQPPSQGSYGQGPRGGQSGRGHARCPLSNGARETVAIEGRDKPSSPRSRKGRTRAVYPPSLREHLPWFDMGSHRGAPFIRHLLGSISQGSIWGHIGAELGAMRGRTRGELPTRPPYIRRRPRDAHTPEGALTRWGLSRARHQEDNKSRALNLVNNIIIKYWK